ncbi:MULTISPECIES: type II toxin-antitoxin system VapC family toxin [Actinokineospora]|uniref:Ribonuclease VapC n=1 Tax=Actinokineospora fastidiosa TaxID=1816 RepID=A0A918LI16_9PSEU|nr:MULTISPECIES: type II toxin-antitoxin system VapC family toxin [Actinokineospora]UVS78011.1 putative ribonuclease VapC47 [Actinokineospora sp. UTMC 2448]GGS50395.1 ribonuclease VapC [Actinokineospora fastidiosa]
MPTLIYFDTSALAKLFVAEQESPDLRHWLTGRPEPRLVSSALLGVELIRLLGRTNPSAVPVAERFLVKKVDLVEITPPVLADATTLPPPRLGTLDAIHLATAMDVADSVDCMVTYDKVLADAARLAGMAVSSPGAPT